MQQISSELSWNILNRMEFLEFRLYWNGLINRRHLMDYFNISEPQASSDFTRYQELAKDNIKYDRSLKAYIPTEKFTPIFWKPTAQEYLSHLRLISDNVENKENNWIGEIPSFDCVPFLRRRMSADILKPVLEAIRSNLAVKISYRSFNNPEPHWRWISPHSLVFDGRRWHARAWCHKNNDFRDFVFARILKIDNKDNTEADPNMDIEWHRTIQLKLIPNPRLSDAQRKIVELEYGMDNGYTTIVSRISLIFYIKEYLNLDLDTTIYPAEKIHLIISNNDEVNTAVHEAKIAANKLLSGIKYVVGKKLA